MTKIKLRLPKGSFWALLQALAVLGVLSGPTDAVAKPRPLSPPWPSFGLLQHEGFDQPYGFATNQVIDTSIWTESWSGWALKRQGVAVEPWIVPMVVSNSFRVEPERGAIRFWYRPDYSSGVGSGETTTLLELVTANDKASEIWWALVVSPDGSEVHLICQTESGPEACLSASVNWTNGSWHLLTVAFTPTNSAIFIDDQLQAVGEGLTAIPNEAAPYTSLIVGSSASGELPAQGQIEELSIFSGRKKMQQVMGNIFGLSVDWEIGIYYAALSKTAALGPISDAEIAERAARIAQRKAEREALGLEEESGGGMQMMMLVGGTAVCVTNSPLYITNTVAWFDTNNGWTVQFDVQGTNSPADIFTTTNLSGNSITNSQWVWLERGPSCSTYQYTNQPAEGSCYILGTMKDTDSDGMTDAYERLVSHTNPNVPDAPVILFQPVSQTVDEGDTVTFSVIADGAQPLSYQWKRGGTNIVGETNTSLTLAAVAPAQATNYSVLVTSPAALSILSSNATLTVQTPTNWPLVTVAGSRQDYTFKNGITYYIGSKVNLYGTTTIEGGAVIKPDDSFTNSTLAIMGSLVCKTDDAYFPAFFTSVDDDTLGDEFPGSSGVPVAVSNRAPYLDLTFAQDAIPALNNLRIRYANQGVSTPKSKRLNVWNSQFVKCNAGLVANKDTTISLHNVLFATCGAAVSGATNFNAIEAEHVTANATNFWAQVAPSQIKLTNSFVIGTLGSGPTLVSDHTVVNPSSSVFQLAGSGHYYLTSTNSYVRAGTTNISTRLLTEFWQKTTQAPLIFPQLQQIAGDMTLGQQAARYTNGAPDYGYYYPALDYTVAWMTLRGNITVLPGTAIGLRSEFSAALGHSTRWGFDLREGSSFVSHGTPSRPNIFTDIQMVQEQLANPCLASFVPDFFPNSSGNPAPSLDFRFSRFYANANWYHVWAGYEETCNFLQSPDSLVNWSLRDCELRGGRVNLGPPDDGFFFGAPMDWYYGACSVSWVNNLFDTVAVTLDPSFYWYNGATNCDMTFTAQNNLFRGGQWFFLSPVPASVGNWTLTDNLFDKVAFAQDTFAPLDFHHNGYSPLTTNETLWADAEWSDYHANDYYGYPFVLVTTNRLQVATNASGGNEQFLTAAPPYQNGPFGNFYLPTTTTLYHAGSSAVTNTALYQYTTQTNQTKAGAETPSGHAVSIGLHYVATTNVSGTLPKDSDGDGIPDFVEDANGNGAVEVNETSPALTQTVSGVHDSTNSVYDDIDLAGNGLVGRIKKALGLNPLGTSNSLTLKQVAFDGEWGIATFELPVQYAVLTNIGELNLRRNGVNVTLEECQRATNGNCLLRYNTDYEPADFHYLQAQITLKTGSTDFRSIMSGVGSLLPSYSSNIVQFFTAGSMFDDSGAFLDAKLAVTNADYIISLYDPSTTPATLIKTITNSTSTGIIQEDWNLTLADGLTLYTGATAQAVFSVTPQSALPPPRDPKKLITKAQGSLSEWGANIMVAYLYTPTNSDLAFSYASGGSIWNGMQGLVDVLVKPVWPYNVYHSYFNRYLPDANGEYPGYITRRTRTTNDSPNLPSITENLLPNLTNTANKTFFCYSHGSGKRLENGYNTVFMEADEVSKLLGNKRSGTNFVTQNPYRFVFLDGCSTASTKDWANAFGIYPLNDPAARNKVGPQAFVGWATNIADWMGGTQDALANEDVSRAYTRTLMNFYLDWMNNIPLAQCIASASVLKPQQAPFPVPGNERPQVVVDNEPYNCIVTTSKIYVEGYSGLTINGMNSSQNNIYAPPR